MSVPSQQDLAHMPLTELVNGMSRAADQQVYLLDVLHSGRPPLTYTTDVVELLRVAAPDNLPSLIDTLFIRPRVEDNWPIISVAVSRCSQPMLNELVETYLRSATQNIPEFLNLVLPRFDPTAMVGFLNAVDLEKICEYIDIPELISKVISHCAPQARYTLMRALTKKIINAENYCVKAITGAEYDEQIHILKIFQGCKLYTNPMYQNNIALQFPADQYFTIDAVLSHQRTNRFSAVTPANLPVLLQRQPVQNRSEENFVIQTCLQRDIIPILENFKRLTIDTLSIAFNRNDHPDYRMLLRSPKMTKVAVLGVIEQIRAENIITFYEAAHATPAFKSIMYKIAAAALTAYNVPIASTDLFEKIYTTLPHIETTPVMETAIRTGWATDMPAMIIKHDFTQNISHEAAEAIAKLYVDRVILGDHLVRVMRQLRRRDILTPAVLAHVFATCPPEKIFQLALEFNDLIRDDATIAQLAYDRVERPYRGAVQTQFAPGLIQTNNIGPDDSDNDHDGRDRDNDHDDRDSDNDRDNDHDDSDNGHDDAIERDPAVLAERLARFRAGRSRRTWREIAAAYEDEDNVNSIYNPLVDESIHNPHSISAAADAQTLDHQLAIGAGGPRINRIATMDSYMVLNTISDWQSITDAEWSVILPRIDQTHYLALWCEHHNAIPAKYFEEMLKSVPRGLVLELLSRNADPSDAAINIAITRTGQTRDTVMNYGYNKAADFLGHIRLKLNPYVGKIPDRYTNICSDLINLTELDYTTSDFPNDMFVIFMHDTAWCLTRRDLQAIFAATDTWRYECVGDPINPREHPPMINPTTDKYHQHPDTQKYKPLVHLGSIWVLAGQLYNVVRRPGGAFFISEKVTGKYTNVVTGSLFTPNPSLVGTAHCSGDEDYYEIFELDDENFKVPTKLNLPHKRM